MGHLSGYGVPLNCSEHIQHNYAYGFITACNFVEGNRIAELFFCNFLAMPKNNVVFFSTSKFFPSKILQTFFSLTCCRLHLKKKTFKKEYLPQ